MLSVNTFSVQRSFSQRLGRVTEGMEDISAGPASPTGSAVDFGHVPDEKREETVAGGESGEEGTEGNAEGGGGDDGDHPGALGIVALPGACCVCIEMEQIIGCLHSEKICILPILACLLSLALCTAGLKWVFVDKIFEYEPPTHLDPKRIGQDPFIISVDPTVGPNISTPHSSPSATPLSTAIAFSPGRPEVTAREKTTRGPHVPQSPSVTLKYNADRSTVPKQTPSSRTTVELNDIFIPTLSATSTTTTAKTSSHVTRCSDSQKNYCVNGGECFTLEIMPGSTKFLCRCLEGFTGQRCEQTVVKRVINPKQHLGIEFMEAEELYQKRILTITGICIALLVVGIMCVVAYCKTKKQRKKLHDRLRRSMRKKRKRSNATSLAREPSHMPLQDLQLVNQCNGMTMQHASEKEPETSFSTSKPALTVHETASLSHTPSHTPSQRCTGSTTCECMEGIPDSSEIPVCRSQRNDRFPSRRDKHVSA